MNGFVCFIAEATLDRQTNSVGLADLAQICLDAAAAGGLGRHLVGRAFASAQAKGDGQGELALGGSARKSSLAPELPADHHIETLDFSVLGRNETEQISLVAPAAILRFQVNGTGHPSILEF